MQSSKLIRSLKKLSDRELQAFGEFLESPYFNKNKDLVGFFKAISQLQLLNGEPAEKDAVLKFIYPNQRYQQRWLSDLMYGLTNLLEAFLSEERYRQNRFQQKINLMALAYERDVEPMINGIEKDLEQLHEKNPVRDSNFYYESFMIHSERDYSFRRSGKISDNENLQAMDMQLDLFYLSQKLKDGCEILNRSRIVSVQYDFKMLETIVAHLRIHTDTYSPYPAIQAYLNYYLMLTEETHEPYFLSLKELVKANENVFTTDELRSLYTYLQNYCIRRINQGSTHYYAQLFDLCSHLVRSGITFLQDNTNMQWDFKNFVSIGLRMKEFEWTRKAIETFNTHLPENVRQNAYTYNLANYYYETGEYQKATKLLNSVEFTDIYYSLDSKTMLLKIYYKVEEEESFYSLVSAFGNYLRRNKLISETTAEVYSNLIKFTKKAFILKTKLPYQKKKEYFKNVEALKNIIHQTQKVANINWLLQEVEALA